MFNGLMRLMEILAYNPQEAKEIGILFMMLIVMVGITLEVLISIYFSIRKKG